MTQKLSNQVNNFRTGAIRETLEQGLPIAVGGSEYPGLALFLGAAISFVGLALTLAVRSEQAAAVGRAQVVENFGTTPIRGLALYFTVVGANEVRMRLPDGSYRRLVRLVRFLRALGRLTYSLALAKGRMDRQGSRGTIGS